MAAATTVKVNDAIEPTMARLRRLVDQRRRTAVRDRVLDEGVQAFSQGAADIGLGLVLLVSASAMAAGTFGVGELAVFTAYLGWLSFLPRMVGRMLARRRQAGVAFDRMRRLVADERVEHAVRRDRCRSGCTTSGTGRWRCAGERVPLDRVEVIGLSARYPSGAGIEDISFTIERGTFTVVTGPIGSGKSTLLRAMLGLAHQATSPARSCGTARSSPTAPPFLSRRTRRSCRRCRS